jgi:predicted ATPase
MSKQVKMKDAELQKDILDLEVTEQNLTGTVTSIGTPQEVQTRFGLSYRIPIIVAVNDTTIPVNMIIRQKTLQRKHLHPRSNLYKLLTAYKCKKLRDLVGKQVNLRIDERGFYRIVY